MTLAIVPVITLARIEHVHETNAYSCFEDPAGKDENEEEKSRCFSREFSDSLVTDSKKEGADDVHEEHRDSCGNNKKKVVVGCAVLVDALAVAHGNDKKKRSHLVEHKD